MSMILIPSYGLIAPPPALVCAILQAAALGLEDLGARRRLQLAGIDRHRQHAVVADRARELDQPVVAEPPDERFHRRVVHPVLAHELSRELDDLRVLGRNAAAVVLANGRDGGLRHSHSASAAGLRAPDIDRLQLARHGHGGEDAHAHVERALEPYKGAEMRQAAGQLRTMQEHREGSLERAPARDDRVDDRLVLGSNLVLVGDRCQPCHEFLLLGVHCGVSPTSHSIAYTRSGVQTGLLMSSRPSKASATALAITAVGGTVAPSPTPRTPSGL